MNTNMAGLKWFSKYLHHPCALDESSPNTESVEYLLCFAPFRLSDFIKADGEIFRGGG